MAICVAKSETAAALTAQVRGAKGGGRAALAAIRLGLVQGIAWWQSDWCGVGNVW